MKNLIICAAVAVATLFTSCAKEEITEFANEEKTALSIQPDIAGASVSTRASVSAFTNGSALGLFVTAGSLGNPYNGLASNSNVKSVFNSNNRTWAQTPAVYLSPASAVVYAYYPYSSGNNNGLAIPIEHVTQVDYMFGTHSAGQSVINSDNSQVNLTMRHALALLQFKFGRSNYTGNGIITKIEIANASGKTCIYSSATLNIATGTITKISGQNNPAFIQNASGLYTIPTAGGTSVEHPNLRIMLLPVTTIAASGDVKIHFTIDGKIYTWNVPASTVWNSGTKNVYTITLSGSELIVGNVTITDWINGVNDSAVLQ